MTRRGRAFLLRPKVLELGAAYLESMDIEQPHQDAPGGAGAPDRRFGGADGARRHRHRLRRARLGAHAGAAGSARRQPLSRLRHLDGPRAARRARARSASTRYFRRARSSGAHRADRDRPEEAPAAASTNAGAPATARSRTSSRTAWSPWPCRCSTRRAAWSPRSTARAIRGSITQGEAGARAAGDAARGEPRDLDASSRACRACR